MTICFMVYPRIWWRIFPYHQPPYWARGCLVQLLDLTLYQSVLLRSGEAARKRKEMGDIGRWEMGMGDGSGHIPHIIRLSIDRYQKDRWIGQCN
jgi:hypothetical protein